MLQVPIVDTRSCTVGVRANSFVGTEGEFRSSRVWLILKRNSQSTLLQRSLTALDTRLL